MEEAGVAIIAPPVTAPHLLDWLFDCGPCDFAMDRVPLGWGTIDAWASRTRTAPSPWEARLLRRLSAAWLAEGRRAEKPECPAPSLDAMPVKDRRKLVDRKLSAIFG